MSESRASVESERRAVTSREAEAIATLGYIYGYPLVLMDTSRAVMTAVPAAGPDKAPMNQFLHKGEFPDDTFRDVVSPNVDTLYSMAWLDLSNEPIVLAVPDFGKRYYTMQLLDAWTNVFASPGTRTTGNGKGAYALVGPGWRGELPPTVLAIQAPTNIVWIIGRIFTAGKQDYDAVHALERQVLLVPLGAWGGRYSPPSTVPVAAGVDVRTPPITQVGKLGAGAFFARLARLMKANPPVRDDAPMQSRLGRIGIVPGETFDLARLPPTLVDAIDSGVAAARARIASAARSSVGKPVDGWRIGLDLGRYGTNYENRAAVALVGLGANIPDDAVYSMTEVDAAGRALSGKNRYALRFAPGELPQVFAFWSVTMYDDDHFLAANPIGRYAVGDRDQLRVDADGSLDIAIQHDDPGPERRSNWLPAPAGGFNLIMRLYYPKPSVLDGSWTPPAVARV